MKFKNKILNSSYYTILAKCITFFNLSKKVKKLNNSLSISSNVLFRKSSIIIDGGGE